VTYERTVRLRARHRRMVMIGTLAIIASIGVLFTFLPKELVPPRIAAGSSP
jgi:multidrug efflux pump subunit AcrB